jgi:hypothetical protein
MKGMLVMAGQYGPSGGPGGGQFQIWPPIDDGFTLDTTPYEIAALIFRTGSYIDSMQVVYRNMRTGIVVVSDKIGGDGGGEAPPFELAQGESILLFGGSTESYVEHLAVCKSPSNQCTDFGGVGSGTSLFQYSWDTSEEVIGFWGRAGAYIDAFGVFVRKRLAL